MLTSTPPTPPFGFEHGRAVDQEAPHAPVGARVGRAHLVHGDAVAQAVCPGAARGASFAAASPAPSATTQSSEDSDRPISDPRVGTRELGEGRVREHQVAAPVDHDRHSAMLSSAERTRPGTAADGSSCLSTLPRYR